MTNKTNQAGAGKRDWIFSENVNASFYGNWPQINTCLLLMFGHKLAAFSIHKVKPYLLLSTRRDTKKQTNKNKKQKEEEYVCDSIEWMARQREDKWW